MRKDYAEPCAAIVSVALEACLALLEQADNADDLQTAAEICDLMAKLRVAQRGLKS